MDISKKILDATLAPIAGLTLGVLLFGLSFITDDLNRIWVGATFIPIIIGFVIRRLILASCNRIIKSAKAEYEIIKQYRSDIYVKYPQEDPVKVKRYEDAVELFEMKYSKDIYQFLV